MEQSKACKACGEVKVLAEFYTQPKMKDGHFNECKSCTRQRVTKNREENIERVRAYDRERGRTLEHKARVVALNTAARKADPERFQAYQVAARARHPEKYRARMALSNAIRDGRAVKGTKCEACGETEGRIHGHHDDYSKPLEVRWLCIDCHNEHHRKYD